MNADPTAQRRLLDLAVVDAELARTAHRRRTMPELVEIEQAEAELRAARDAVITAETTVGDLDRDIRKLEGEVEQVRAREDRDRKLMDSGSITSGKQLDDLQHELATLGRRQGVLEDELLEVMEQREATGAEVERATAVVAGVQERLVVAGRRRDEALADLESTEARRGVERTGLVAGLPTDLMTLYERIRAQKGAGAALLRQRRCGACRLEIDSTAMNAFRDAAPEAVLRCEECGVIQVRTAESGL